MVIHMVTAMADAKLDTTLLGSDERSYYRWDDRYTGQSELAVCAGNFACSESPRDDLPVPHRATRIANVLPVIVMGELRLASLL